MGNIRDIARKAGVSVATVSRVLNHHPYVKEDKRMVLSLFVKMQGKPRSHLSLSITILHLKKCYGI